MPLVGYSFNIREPGLYAESRSGLRRSDAGNVTGEATGAQACNGSSNIAGDCRERPRYSGATRCRSVAIWSDCRFACRCGYGSSERSNPGSAGWPSARRRPKRGPTQSTKSRIRPENWEAELQVREASSFPVPLSAQQDGTVARSYSTQSLINVLHGFTATNHVAEGILARDVYT